MITRSKLNDLLNGITSKPVLSVFHPTDRVAVEPEENSLRLKNLIHDAGEQLKDAGLRRPDIDELLHPLEALLEDRDFWQHQMEGFAAFRAKDTFEYYRVPFKLPERVYVRDQPYIKPLLRALWPQARFYILAISQHSVRLLECTDYAAEEVNLTGLDVPKSIEEALRYDDLQKPESQDNPRTGPGRAGGFHGHGPGGEDHKEQIRRFFKAVDEGLMKRIGTETAPLIIASVEFEYGHYREVSDYRYILDERIEGSPDRLRPAQLHAEALPIIDRVHRKELDELRERHGSLMPNDLASCDTEEVVIAAFDGRVESLFLLSDVEQWGSYDLDSRAVKLDGDQNDDNLHELAARATIQNGGAVYVLGTEEMPCDSPMGAIFRYRYGENPPGS
jgi:hypothetical protein